MDLEESKDETFAKMGEARFLSTTQLIMHFANNRSPNPGDRIVYLDGYFDLLHLGHIELIQKAKALGDFLYVGINEDHLHRDTHMTLNERVLMVLAQKSVDDVIIGAPMRITNEVMKAYNISVVVPALEAHSRRIPFETAYEVPMVQGKVRSLTVESNMGIDLIVQRIVNNQEAHL